MSWFDAAGLANIAKSALKEAQRTIDKALDIKDEANVAPTNTPVDPGLEDFFGTWGLTQSGNVKPVKKDCIDDRSNQEGLTTSLWGSFTGSFFDNGRELHKIEKFSASSSLEDTVDVSSEHFNQSKLVVQQSEETDQLPLLKDETDYVNMSGQGVNKENLQFVDINLSNPNDSTNLLILSSPTNIGKKSDKPQSLQINRLSVISNESEKNSSESVDIITYSTECTSPESDLLSLSLSLSTSSSALGLKPTSDSVEVLGDSLTSPSSVEVIGSNSTNSRRHSQHTDEFASPLDSPWLEEKSSSVEKISPESVEVIPEDQDENSVAEDTMSYTSVSESTSATILDSAFNPLMKHPKMLKDTFTRTESLAESPIYDISSSPEKNYPFTDAITRAPSRSTMQLPLTQVNQVLIDTQPQSTKSDMTSILQKTNIIDIPNESDITSSIDSQMDMSIDDGSQSDKTLIGSDNIMESSSDTSTTTETSSNSTYLKNMLADAMTEKSSVESRSSKFSLVGSTGTSAKNSNILDSISLSQIDLLPRENSPISSESRSDLIKIGSDQTSGHTSGDELETTTSSDIEIISSPNGDSSSTQSRQSPAKATCMKSKTEDSTVDSLLCKMSIKKSKGHNRELSEASSISDDSHSSEIDRLLKRISEMTEILESRESKLIDMNRRHVELQEQNSDLRLQLDSILTKQLESVDVSQVTEEYTQRLSALEKKFQQAIREKDSLRKQLDQVKQEAASRMSKCELETLINEKDETIKELREEGEKLSKQQLQHSNIIKKLRSKEKENEIAIKHLRESVESLSAESDRLKKSLAAKEEVERTQIEAVHQLTTKNKKFENESHKLKEQIDDLTQKYDTVKKSLDAAKKELTEKTKTSSELLLREQMLESLETQKKMTESQNEEVLSQLENLRHKIRQNEEEFVKKEQKFREENSKLLRRLEDTEARNEELSQSVLEVSKPLVRQLDSLQATHNMKVATFEKIEEELTMKMRELQTKLQTSSSSERIAKEECINLRSKLAEVEGQQSSTNHQIEMLEMQLEQIKTEKLMLQQEFNSKFNHLDDIIEKNKETIFEQDKQIANLQQELSLEKSANELERRQIETIQNRNKEKQENRDGNVLERISPRTGSNSPTLSIGKGSMSESMSSSFWSQDEPFDISQMPRYTNMFEMQMLQTNLKQREGEVQQLQWELSRREQERSLLNTEISTLLTKVEELETKMKDYDSLNSKLQELEKQYDTLCQLFGEKVEENEELKLDLQDVKDMYKGQIDELLRQLKQK